MKKLISILLVAVLIIGMLPATALTAFADTEIVFELGANGTASHYDGSSATTYSETVDGYTLNITGGTKMYTGARDAKGNSCIKLGTSSAAGSFNFTVPDDVTSVVIHVAAYKAKTATMNINGITTTLTTKSDNGTYDEITVDTTGTKTVSVAVSSGYRAMVNTITFVVSGGSSEPTCTHENTEILPAEDATCTAEGKTEGEICLDCGETLTEQEPIPMIPHDYDSNGICTECGAEKPDGFALVTDVSSLKANDEVIITVTNASGVYAMSNNKGTGSAPAAVAVTLDNGVITEAADTLIWNISYDNGSLTIYPKNQTTTWLYCTATNNGVRVGTNTNKAFTVDASTGYLKHTTTSRYLGVYNNQDWRCYTSHTTANIANQILAFYVKSAGGDCDHSLTVTIPEVPATCTDAGTEEIQKCACGQNVQGGAEIPALGHSYTDDACIRCNVINPDAENWADLMTATPNEGDVIVIYNPANKFLMSATANGNFLGAAGATAVDGQVPYSNTAVAVMTVHIVDGNYVLVCNDKYLTAGETGNTLSFADTESELSQWTITPNDSNTGWYITNVAASFNGTDFNQTIEYYNGQFKPFGFDGTSYLTSYAMELYLVEAGEEPACTHEGTTELQGYTPGDCTTDGYTGDTVCTECGVTLDKGDVIPAPGHNFEDGACTECGEPDPLANLPGTYYIAAKRSSGNYWYMTRDLGTASSKRYQAVDSGLTELPAAIAESEDGFVFEIVANGDGTYSLLAVGVEGDNYLGWKEASDSAANNGILVAEEDALKVTIDITDDGCYNIHFTATDAERYLSLNGSTGSNYFAWYKNTQRYNLSLIPAEVPAKNVVSVGGSNFTSVEEALDEIATNGGELTLLDDVTIDAEGITEEVIVDLAGNTATVTNAENLCFTDSTATSTAAGSGKVVSTEGVVMDHIDGNTRWIALEEEENTYSFHILELELNKITLRTNRAGLYYKATITCDPTLINAVETYGVLLNASGEIPEDFDENKNGWTTVANDGETALSAGKIFTSGSVFNIFKDDADNNTRGKTEIHAHAYLKLNDGTVLKTTASKSYSLYEVMAEMNDEAFINKLTEKQTKALDAFYDKWYEVLDAWGMTVLANKFKNN